MSERRAYFCTHKECRESKMGARRIFLLPGEPDSAAECRDHGKRYMVRQLNAPYSTNSKAAARS